MKLRIRGNSIRIRLSQTETADLGEDRLLHEQTKFPRGNSLDFQLTTGEDFGISFKEETILITVPKETVRKWTHSEELSLSHDFPLPNEDNLWLLVEKDLSCKTDRPREDDSDAFPNTSTTNC